MSAGDWAVLALAVLASLPMGLLVMLLWVAAKDRTHRRRWDRHVEQMEQLFDALGEECERCGAEVESMRIHMRLAHGYLAQPPREAL